MQFCGVLCVGELRYLHRTINPQKEQDLMFATFSIMPSLDPRLKLPTRRKPKDPGTTDAVLSSREKVVVRGVARSIVNISSSTHGKISG